MTLGSCLSVLADGRDRSLGSISVAGGDWALSMGWWGIEAFVIGWRHYVPLGQPLRGLGGAS